MAQPSQADILAALQAQGPSYSRPKPTSKAYVEVQDPYTELTNDGISASRMYCPREGCGCLILLEGTADWVLAEAKLVCHLPACLASIPGNLIHTVLGHSRSVSAKALSKLTPDPYRVRLALYSNPIFTQYHAKPVKYGPRGILARQGRSYGF